ncbi:hypothetical protein ATG_06310 [Desulfurococcaceae archaeon AG1]|nr:hypothetical protein ATG_06310 [Desulfurococcaceae archaeon AG1]
MDEEKEKLEAVIRLKKVETINIGLMYLDLKGSPRFWARKTFMLHDKAILGARLSSLTDPLLPTPLLLKRRELIIL